MVVIGFLLYLVALICAIWVIYDVWTYKKRRDTLHKIIWTLFALFFSIITAIVYYLVEKR